MPSVELDTLRDLMKDFDVSGMEPEEALKTIQNNYLSLETALERRVSDILLELGSIAPSKLWPDYAKGYHRDLFRGILSNAGNYRQSAEPDGGTVCFGSCFDEERTFRGTPPHEIPEQMAQIGDLLVLNPPDPIRQAVTFYQKFVYCHPFYDGNGRIGRLLVTTYLQLHRHDIRWEQLRSNTEWLKKMNKCHTRQKGDAQKYDKYLEYLIDHWRKFISTQESEEGSQFDD